MLPSARSVHFISSILYMFSFSTFQFYSNTTFFFYFTISFSFYIFSLQYKKILFLYMSVFIDPKNHWTFFKQTCISKNFIYLDNFPIKMTQDSSSSSNHKYSSFWHYKSFNLLYQKAQKYILQYATIPVMQNLT